MKAVLKSSVKLILLLLVFSAMPVSAVEVFQAHPRLFFRDSTWGERSITTEQLKQRVDDPRYAAYRNRLTYSACNVALRACLTDDSAAAEEAITMLRTPFAFGGTTTDGELVMWAAMAFDWLYNHHAFTDEIKQEVVSTLAAGASYLRNQYSSQGAHIFHTRMPAFVVGVAMAGLAIDGHHSSSQGHIEWADSVMTQHIFPGRELQDGTVHNSLAYGRRYTMWHTGHFMSAWYSATGQDKWADIRANQGDWAWREALFMMHARQPDSLFVRFGDNYRRTSERYTFRVIGERAFAYDEPVGKNYLNYLFETQAAQSDNRVVEEGNSYNVFLWWDADSRGFSFRSLPGRAMFSPDGTGMVLWRSGWDEGETHIFFKCGNYFGDHGHFDQGHVEVFRHKPLLIESGYYDSFSSTHRTKYYRGSMAHNTIRAKSASILNYLGEQRMFSNQNKATLQNYLADPLNETGDLIDYRDNGTWSYAAGEFASAYNSSLMDKVVRELAWIGERYLVVVDNVVMDGTDYLPAVMWHYAATPQLEQGRFTVSDGGGKAVVTVLSPPGASIDTVAAYKLGSLSYPPPDPQPEHGTGRVEVSATVSSSQGYTFVEVIEITDDSVVTAVPVLETDPQSGAISIVLPEGTLYLAGEPEARTEVSFTPAQQQLRGDYDGDGALGIGDLVAFALLSIRDGSAPALDFNRDSSVSTSDMLDLLIYIRTN
jgi:hypothetical protein